MADTEADQLQSAGDETPDGQTVNTVTWGYDANGNRVTENNQTIAQYDEQDRLLRWKGKTYRYTPAGDLQERQSPEGRSRYHYDAQGNLRRVETESGRNIKYAIDPLNRRIGQQIDGQWQWWLLWLDKLRPLARLDAQGQLESIYYYGDHANVPEGLRKNGQDYRIITDQIGSVRLVVNAETGEEMQRIDYDEWGQITLDTNPGFQPFGFAGGLYDPDTGLTRFGARDYDAETGRWTAKDPILFDGGEVGLYSYVEADPLRRIDPSGEAGLLGPAVGVGITVYGLSKMFVTQSSCEKLCEITQGDSVQACGDPERQDILDTQKNQRVLACKASCAMGSVISRLLPGKLK
ncbi:MAG: RHS repeat-associated core domain-containing protein [Curvibacter sp.]|nr:RHS repeat-associated core domain-containing protein [Curvibacter sp.]